MKCRADRWSVLSVVMLFAGWAAAGWFIYLSMGGGFLGILLNWCLGVLLLVPIGFVVRDLIVRRPNAWVRLAFGLFALVGLTTLSLLLLGNLVMTWRSNPVHDIAGQPSGTRFTRTRFEFHKDAAHFIIHDPGNRLRFCFGSVPAAVRVEGDERVVVFDDWVILKSWTFDYGFEGEAINFGGWMGADSNEPVIEIGPEGTPVPSD